MGAIALLTGAIIALVFGNPYIARTRTLTPKLLSWSVIGLGAGMDLRVVARVGAHGVGYTVVGILIALSLGTLLGKLLRVRSDTSLLISVGTAICGGSAIAAVAPTIGAEDTEVSVSLAIVFLLNAVALLVFPLAGHALALTQQQFGLWCALAIHDTSSVVGATLGYGSDALAIGTTVKLARALWIVPVTLAIGFYRNRNRQHPGQNALRATQKRAKKPWFILGFLLMAALVTWIPALQPAGHLIETIARYTLVLTLFFIGTNLTRATLARVGVRPFLQGFILWIVVSAAALLAIYAGAVAI